MRFDIIDIIDISVKRKNTFLLFVPSYAGGMED